MMRSRRRKSEPVDPSPRMDRGESPFEEKRIECEFTLLMNRVSKMSFTTFTESCEYIFRQGYFTGKAAGKRENLGSPTTETRTSPLDASVRQTAGAQKEKQDGTTTSD
jgi:hypothetical protein